MQPTPALLIPGLDRSGSLLLCTLFAIVGLIVLIVHFKLHAFLALSLAALMVGFSSGMELGRIAGAFQDGVGAILGSVAMVVGLGTVLGKMLAESGGAAVVARRMIGLAGEKQLHWAVAAVAFIVGLPVFFAVGLVLLTPIVFTLVRQSKRPLLLLAIPLVAGLSVAHVLVPPHPGPMVAIAALGADVGMTILYSVAIGAVTTVIAGPLFGSLIARLVNVPLTDGVAAELTVPAQARCEPNFALALLTILLPVLLMMLGTFGQLILPTDSRAIPWLALVGHPIVSLLIAVLFSYYSLGYSCGLDRRQILTFSETCLRSIAGALLVIGAGGGFNRVLLESGVGEAISSLASSWQVPPLVLGWLIASAIRVATGSATVAISTAAGMMAPVVAGSSAVNVELLIVAMGAGSLILSHVNDGGFWLVKEYLGFTVGQTLKTWTIMETLIAVVAFLLTLVVDLIV